MINANKLVKNYLFNVNEPLGKGQFSTVFLAQNTDDKQIYALKVMALNEIKRNFNYSEVIENEFKALSSLQDVQSPHIVHLVEWFRTEKFLYVVMDYCDGGDLDRYLADHGALSEARVQELLSHFVSGYSEIRKKKLMHRDVKLSNLMLHQSQLKICDFGFSKLVETFYEPMGHSIKGTPLTMAPQVFRGDEYSDKCDVWSLGIVLYQLLFNQTPWDSSDGMSSYFQRVMHEPIRFPRSPRVSDHMKDFITRCLQLEETTRLSWEQIFEHPALPFNRKVKKALTLDLPSLETTHDSQGNTTITPLIATDVKIDLPGTPTYPIAKPLHLGSATTGIATEASERLLDVSRSPLARLRTRNINHTDSKAKPSTTHFDINGRSKSILSNNTFKDLNKMLDDHRVVKARTLHNHKSNLSHVHNLSAFFGKISYLLAAKDKLLKQFDLGRESLLLDLLFIVMRMTLVSYYVQILNENPNLFSRQDISNKKIAKLIETVHKNEEVYIKYFHNFYTTVFAPSREEFRDSVELNRFLERLDKARLDQRNQMRSLFPNREVFLSIAVPVIEEILRLASSEFVGQREKRDLVLITDYLLECIVLQGLANDIFNGSHMPFLQEILVQATKSKELMGSLEIDVILKNLKLKKDQILSKIIRRA